MKKHLKLFTVIALFSSLISGYADDHGDTLGSATTWTTEDIAGNLESDTDVDWLKITITTPGRVWFYSTGNTDTDAELYDDSGNKITPNTSPDDDGAGYNFMFVKVIQTGTYYLAVTSGGSGNLTGNYTLSVRAPQYAQVFDGHNLEDSLTVLGDRNLYKITLTQEERVWLFTTGGIDTNAFLFNAAGQEVTPNSSPNDDGAGYNFLFNAKFPADTYYLMIRDGGTGLLTGDYTLSIRASSKAQNFATPNRESSLEVLGDMDLYRIDLPVDDRIWIFSTGDTDTNGLLYDASGNEITPNTTPDDDGAAFNFRFTGKYSAGTYYLLVTATQKLSGYGPLIGDYTLSFRSTHTAMYFQGSNEPHSLGVPGDLDLYRIDVNQTGPVWIYTTGNTDTYGTLYNDAGNDITPNTAPDNDGAGKNFQMAPVLTPNSYYLLVERGSTGNLIGNYTLSVRDASRSIPLTSSGVTNGNISPLGSLNLYTFTTSGGTVEFLSTGTTDTKGILYDNAGNNITANTSPDDDGIGNNFLFTQSLTAGDYYLLVRGQNIETVTGSYQLDADFNAGSLTRLSSPSAVIGSQTSGTIDVTSNTSWSVSGLPSWITASQTSGNGSGTVSLNYSPNLTGTSREASITIGGQSYTVVQRAQGDQTGAIVPAQISLHLGIVITVPTQAGVTYRIESSTNMSSWSDTGATLQGDGTPRIVVFEKTEAREFYRAVPQ